MHDPIDRAIRELTEDRGGIVDDLREIEMAVWPDSEQDEEQDEDEDERE